MTRRTLLHRLAAVPLTGVLGGLLLRSAAQGSTATSAPIAESAMPGMVWYSCTGMYSQGAGGPVFQKQGLDGRWVEISPSEWTRDIGCIRIVDTSRPSSFPMTIQGSRDAPIPLSPHNPE